MKLVTRYKKKGYKVQEERTQHRSLFIVHRSMYAKGITMSDIIESRRSHIITVVKEKEEEFHPVVDVCCGPNTFCSTYGEYVGLALDAIVVSPSPLAEKQSSGKGLVASSDFLVQFPVNLSAGRTSTTDKQHVVLVQINGNTMQEEFLSMSMPHRTGAMCTFSQGHSTKPSTDILDELVKQRILIPGKNLIRYILVRKSNITSSQDRSPEYLPIGQAEAYVFLWNVNDSIIISDIDGTITKSDIRGVFDSIISEKYAHVHEGVCSLYSDLIDSRKEIRENQNNQGEVRVLYLSSRPMRLIRSTRKFLSGLSQKTQVPQNSNSNGSAQGIDKKESFVRLPSGPVFLHSGVLSTVLVTELLKKTTHEFKADLLARQIVLPFVAAGKKSLESPLFLAGFGNKRTDYLAYEMVGMNTSDIYIINKNSILESTSIGLELEDDDGSGTAGCFSWESTYFMRPKENISSKNISVSNPNKVSASTMQKKRKFNGYGDPQLREELMNRILVNDDIH